MIDVPGSILQACTVSEVEDHCKKLIKTCGKDGGFIMTATALDEAKPENVKAMMDVTKSYGRYA
jgi:uroporphyrinogen-III decarboxylase